MKKVVAHYVAPADLVLENIQLRQLSALTAIVFIIVVFAVVFLAPLGEHIHFFRIRENYFEEGLFFYGFQIIV